MAEENTERVAFPTKHERERERQTRPARKRSPKPEKPGGEAEASQILAAFSRCRWWSRCSNRRGEAAGNLPRSTPMEARAPASREGWWSEGAE